MKLAQFAAFSITSHPHVLQSRRGKGSRPGLQEILGLSLGKRKERKKHAIFPAQLVGLEICMRSMISAHMLVEHCKFCEITLFV
jgi:hypothetical protein